MPTALIDAANAALVDAALTELAQGGEMFTAWNVTANAKRNGATQYHNDMKGLVHEAYEDGTLQQLDYTRTLINTPTGEAWLYHKVGANIAEFVAFINNNPPPSVPPAAAKTTPTDSATSSMSVAPPDPAAPTAASGAKSQSVDAEGRLPLYADTLRDIGANPGNTVLVYITPTKVDVVLAANATPNSKPNHTYIVNADGRVRLSKTTLLSLLSKTGTYTVSVNGNVIEVVA